MLIMRRVDGEISTDDDRRLDEHVRGCPSCAKALEEYSKLAQATSEVEMKDLTEQQWELYWTGVYNRLERSAAWVLVCLGAAAVLAYVGFRAVVALVGDPDMQLWAKVGVLALVFRFVLLFLSVLRERLTLRRFDKYRKVKR